MLVPAALLPNCCRWEHFHRNVHYTLAGLLLAMPCPFNAKEQQDGTWQLTALGSAPPDRRAMTAFLWFETTA